MEDLGKKPKLEGFDDGPKVPEPEPVDPNAMLEALGKNDMYANKPRDDDKDEWFGRKHAEASEN